MHFSGGINRPPYETADGYLQTTEGCSHNHCLFCTYFKEPPFRKSPIEEIAADIKEMPRVFGDSLCRALAVMKNCRLLSPGEFFDLLSPLRLAAREGMLDGMASDEIEKMLLSADLSGAEDKLGQEERDRVDADRADDMNRRFEDVVLNERAEEKFL